MERINPIEPANLSREQFESVRVRLTTLCDRMCDAQVLDLADALHEVLRTRQRLRCQVARGGGQLRPMESRTF